MKLLIRKFYILNQKQKASSLYLALMIMSVLLVLLLGISTILVSQIRVMKKMEDSVIAFYAADSAYERGLAATTSTGTYPGYLDLNNNGFEDNEDASSTLEVYSSSTQDCPATALLCFRGEGIYKNSRRAIRGIIYEK